MGLEDAEKEFEKGDVEDAVKDLEEEVNSIERDFETVKDDSASGDLQEKQEKAEKILNEIHDQMEFLQEQMDRIEKDDPDRSGVEDLDK
jgi:DNA repair exonuclease SbcCD ATPase subunit